MNFKRATKRLLILILALAVAMPSMIFTTNVFAATSAYTLIDATTLDKTSSFAGQGELQFMANRIGSIWPQGYLVYRNIDFGNTPPLLVEATAGAREGHATTVKIMIDKPNSDPIALVPITQIEFAVPETNSAEMLQKVTGVHDVYITTVASTIISSNLEPQSQQKLVPIGDFLPQFGQFTCDSITTFSMFSLASSKVFEKGFQKSFKTSTEFALSSAISSNFSSIDAVNL